MTTRTYLWAPAIVAMAFAGSWASGCGSDSAHDDPQSKVDASTNDPTSSGDGGTDAAGCQFPDIAPKGKLDPTFKNGSIDASDLLARVHSYAFDAMGIVVDAQGRAILFGNVGSVGGGPLYKAAFLRLLADGALDTTFGIKIIEPSHDTYYREMHASGAIAIDDRDRIVAAGTIELNAPQANPLATYVARLEPSGTFDASFGVPVLHKTESPRLYPERSIATDGTSVYISGTDEVSTDAGAPKKVPYLERLGPNGAIDPTFAVPSAFAAIALTPTSVLGMTDTAIRSYQKTDGAPTAGFGNNGSVTLAHGPAGSTEYYRRSLIAAPNGGATAMYWNEGAKATFLESFTSTGAPNSAIQNQQPGVDPNRLAAAACSHIIQTEWPAAGALRTVHIAPHGERTSADTNVTLDAGSDPKWVTGIDRRTGQVIVLQQSRQNTQTFYAFRVNPP